MSADQNVISPQPGFQEKFVASRADVVWGGGAAGAGKSFALLLCYLMFCTAEGMGGAYFRRTMTQIKALGGLWDTSEELFMQLPKEERPSPNTVSANWTFPNGNRLTFNHLQHEKNKNDWQGTQIAILGFDELTHFSESMYWYLISRSRSRSDYRSLVRCTMNPQGDGWVKDFLVGGGYVYPDDYHIESLAGYPVQSMAGVIRWYIRYEEKVIWGDTKRDVAFGIPKSSRHLYTGADVKSFTFIPGKLDDNPILLKNDPGYRGNLLSQSVEDQAQLLGGRWSSGPDNRLKLIDTPSLRDLFSNDFVPGGEPFLTADIAMEGADDLVLNVWDGWILTDIYTYPVTMGDEVLKKIKQVCTMHGIPGKNVAFDSQGVGNYLKGFLRSAVAVSGSAKPYPVEGVANGKKEERPNYANLRSQLHFYARDKIQDYETYCAVPRSDPEGERLFKELNAIHKKETGHDQKLAIEPKDAIKERLAGKSPDRSDAFVLRAALDLAPRKKGRRTTTAG